MRVRFPIRISYLSLDDPFTVDTGGKGCQERVSGLQLHVVHDSARLD
jgi:hypothetical protein